MRLILSLGLLCCLAQSALAQTWTRELRAGWNAVALHCRTVTNLTSNPQLQALAWWDGSRYQLRPVELAALNEGEGPYRGLWILAAGPTTLSWSGSEVGRPDRFALHAGWNLVAPPVELTAAQLTPSVPLLFQVGPDGTSEVADSLSPERPSWLYSPGPAELAWNASLAPLPSPTQVQILGYAGNPMEPHMSPDGRYLLFNNRNTEADPQLHFAERLGPTRFAYRGELQGVNTPFLEAVPTLDSAGNFYFISNRSYASDLSTVYRGLWSAGTVTAVQRAPGLGAAALGTVQFDVEVTRSGQHLLISEGLITPGAGLPTSADLILYEAAGGSFTRQPGSWFAEVNTPELEYAPALSPNGLDLYFTRVVRGLPPALYRARRGNATGQFGGTTPLQGLGTSVEAPAFDPTGSILYYHKVEPASTTLWAVCPR